MAKEQKLNYGDDTTSALRQARKRRFQLKEEKRTAQDIELLSYLNQLIIRDAERDVTSLKEKEAAKSSDGNNGEAQAINSEVAQKIEEIEQNRESCISRLNDLFSKVDERRRVRVLSKFIIQCKKRQTCIKL